MTAKETNDAEKVVLTYKKEYEYIIVISLSTKNNGFDCGYDYRQVMLFHNEYIIVMSLSSTKRLRSWRH